MGNLGRRGKCSLEEKKVYMKHTGKKEDTGKNKSFFVKQYIWEEDDKNKWKS